MLGFAGASVRAGPGVIRAGLKHKPGESGTVITDQCQSLSAHAGQRAPAGDDACACGGAEGITCRPAWDQLT